jgi:hypothetical protein
MSERSPRRRRQAPRPRRPAVGAGLPPAERFARIGGLVLIVAGVIGLLFGAGFVGAGGWQDALHLVAGVLGLAAASSWAREYALGFGLLFTVLGVWGLLAGDGSDLLGELPVTTAAALGHLLLGLVGLGAGAATAAPSRPERPVRRRQPARGRPPATG